MKTKNIVKYLNSFGKYIVQQSRSNLTKKKKNVSKSLYNSIKFKVVPDKDGFVVQFLMNDYGAFLDKGVKGTKSNYIENKNTKFSYRTKQPPSSIIEKWIKRKGLKGRVDKNWKSAGNRGGQFISNKSFAFLVARSIKQKGIKSISFFQRPLELGMKKFGKELLGAITSDIRDTLSTTTVK